MTSSMLTGERRWASARRGGMTIIGKVVAPKPINLPSERLENHGLNPNVEIVPKGTLSWGSRSSSSASNAWGSSTLSPTTDGGTGSPSHLSGRPSSGGSGTRPSTAGSDRVHEPTSNAWGPSPRPSSASGALTSNQTSVTSLRPRSAETRPGSSQLSRFAESSENSVAWAASGTAEKLGVTHSKKDGFSLSSGDFPTLGSEKDSATKNAESQEHQHGIQSRPGSSSSEVSVVRERSGASPTGDASANSNLKSGNVNTWRRDNAPHDGFRPNVEKWQGEPQGPQPYQNANMPPQPYGPWHGTPASGGVWYRGPPGGPPYGPPVGPGGFPMEYPYYHPQIPATALPNSQPIPPPGAGPRGPHPNTGDMYRPHIPDAYIRPGMPVGPGYYPPVAYEGFYAPPMGYGNTNERDIPFRGMAPGPSVYNRYTSQTAPDSSKSQAGPGGYGSTAKAFVPEQMESGHPQDPRGQYKVLLKHHNGWDGKEEEQKWEHAAPIHASNFEKGDQPRTTSWENNWRPDYKKHEHMDSRRMAVVEEASPQSLDYTRGASVPGKVKVVNEHVVKETDIDVSASSENLATSKDTTLIQKIEGLNAKARASDGKHDMTCVSGREDQKSKHVVNARVVHPTNEGSSVALGHGKTLTTVITHPASFDVGVATGDKGLEKAAISETSLPRKAIHGAQGRVDHRSKGGRFNAQETDGWQKKAVVEESSAVSGINSEHTNVLVQGRHISVEVTENSGSYLEGKDDSESVASMSDPSDIQAQRAKMREIAKQRAKQLQKEEEERTREQKAKALAKLEELNRRTQALEGSTQKLENFPPGEPTISTSKVEAPNPALVSSTNVTAHNCESSSSQIRESAILSTEPPIEASKNTSEVSIVTHNQSLQLQQDVDNAVAAEIAPQYPDSSAPKQRRVSYKQKLNTPSEKSSFEKITASANEAPKSYNEVESIVPAFTEVVNETASVCESSLPVNSNVVESSLPVNPNVMPEPVHQRRKNNRNGRNKHKQEETASVAGISSVVPKDTNIAKASVESGKPKPSEWELDLKPVEPMTSSKNAVQSLEQHSSLPSEESHNRVNNQWKSQNPRKVPRTQQVNRSTDRFHSGDAVVWAPVRSHKQSEVTDEANHKIVLDEAVILTTRSDNPVQNNLKNKRAEMERYVPKPVAKELAQQGCIQQPMSPSSKQISSDDIGGIDEGGSHSVGNSQPAGMVIGKIGSSTGSKNGDNKQHKQTKAHGSWRQRGSSESAHVQALQDGSSFSSKQSKNIQEPVEHNQPMKPDVYSVEVQAQSSDEWKNPDEWNTPVLDSAASIASPVVKDQGFKSRGKRHPNKGHKVTGNNSNYEIDHKNTNSGYKDKVHSQSSALEINETDRTVASKDNRAVGERSISQWQPKSQAYSSHNQRGSRPSGSQNVTAEAGRFVKKESAPKPHPSSKNEEISDGMNQSHREHSMSTTVEDAPNVGHQDAKREMKVASLKGHPHSLNQGSVSVGESAPNEGLGARHEQQRFPSGFRKNGNQNNRFARGHEARRDWVSAGQDSKQQSQPANRERQRHNSEQEYQPIGPYNSNKSNFEGPGDGSSRFRERGQSHSRRAGGNFYGRQSGTVRVDASYD